MSSSATTEREVPDGHPATAARPRHVPVLLAVAAILSVLLIVAGVLALLGQGSPSTKGLPTSSEVGVRLSHFPHPPLVGAPGRLGTPWGHHHGAVLLFFADWCSVCHGELHRIARELGPDIGTVHVVGFDGDTSAGTAASFVASNHVRFPVAWDGELEVASVLARGGFPASVFVSQHGVVKAVDYGAISNMELSAGLSLIGHATASS